MDIQEITVPELDAQTTIADTDLGVVANPITQVAKKITWLNIVGYITGAARTFASTIKATTGIFTNLTDGYLPYHVNDTSGLANTGVFWDSANSRVGINTATPGTAFESVGAGHTFTDTTANNTNKFGRILCRSYNTAQAPFQGLSMAGLQTSNLARIGGGSVSHNCATEIYFYTGALNTTTGTLQGVIGSTNFLVNLPFRFALLTGTAITALTPAAGWTVYNTTTNKLQVYNGTTWVDLH